ncbi:hypothetical protein [Synechococcus sp. CBW1107]|uniref:hypothetical protein n=1 Tax=Synechococcus sp. CBW1107 TaxID=2789857 RepID=UPI001E4626A8|nr:hypothetical protein [Synechococcus sp. CBW1107]
MAQEPLNGISAVHSHYELITRQLTRLLKEKIENDRGKGIITVIYTFLGNSRFGDLSYSISLIKAIKGAHPQANIMLHIPFGELDNLQPFSEILEFVLIFPDVFEFCSSTLSCLETIGPDLVISQDWNLSNISKTKPFPFVFINTHPYASSFSLQISIPGI